MTRARVTKSKKSSSSTKQRKLRAYVLIQTVPGRVEAIIRSRERMPTAGTVDPVTGPYDIVALLEVDDIRQISHLVTGTIGGMRGVTCTTTLICT